MEQENTILSQMSEELHTVTRQLSELRTIVEKLFTAMVGNEIAGDGGLVKRVKDLEQRVEELQEEINTIKTNAIKSDMYVKWMWGLVGAFASGIFAYVLQLIFKH